MVFEVAFFVAVSSSTGRKVSLFPIPVTVVLDVAASTRDSNQVPGSVERFRDTPRWFLRSVDDIFVVHENGERVLREQRTEDGSGNELEGISIGRPISGATLLAMSVRLSRSTRSSSVILFHQTD